MGGITSPVPHLFYVRSPWKTVRARCMSPVRSINTLAINSWFLRGGAGATAHELGWKLGKELRRTAGWERLARPKTAIRSGGRRARQQRSCHFRLAWVGGSVPAKTSLSGEGSIKVKKSPSFSFFFSYKILFNRSSIIGFSRLLLVENGPKVV